MQNKNNMFLAAVKKNRLFVCKRCIAKDCFRFAKDREGGRKKKEERKKRKEATQATETSEPGNE